MERIHIRPRKLKPSEVLEFGFDESETLRVLDPMTNRPLPKDGQMVVQTSYWTRRLADGDVEIVQSPARSRVKPRPISAEE